MNCDEFFQEYLAGAGLPADTQYVDCYCFEYSEAMSNKLLDMVLAGRKRATASSLYSYKLEQNCIPQVGDLSIITNWDGEPKCIIRTTGVTVVPFNSVTYALCSHEGEFDGIEKWRQGHEHFFREDAAKLGYAFSEDMPIVFEDFTVVYRARD